MINKIWGFFIVVGIIFCLFTGKVDILNKEIKLITNNDYYKKLGNNFIPTSNYDEAYNNDNSITVKIKAIIRGKEDKEMFTNQALIFYTGALVDKIISINKDSEIVKAQEDKDYNILTGTSFDDTTTKEDILAYLGANIIKIKLIVIK